MLADYAAVNFNFYMPRSKQIIKSLNAHQQGTKILDQNEIQQFLLRSPSSSSPFNSIAFSEPH